MAFDTPGAGVVKCPSQNGPATSGVGNARMAAGLRIQGNGLYSSLGFHPFVSKFDSMTHRGRLPVQATPARLSRCPSLEVWLERLQPIAESSAPLAHD